VTQADTDASAMAGKADARIPLDFEQDGKSVPFTLKGYAFTQSASDISGDRWTQYDPSKKRTYTIPFFRDLRITHAVQPPAAYAVPAAWSDVIAKLEQHGVRVERLARAQRVHATGYVLGAPKWATQPFENRLMLKDFTQTEEPRDEELPANTAIVRMDQRSANVIAHLLEPQAPDSLLRWGWFNLVFEQREYADARVAERIARELLAQRAELKAEFEEKLKDPEFAKSPDKRLEFFFNHSPWRDERVGRYPVVKLDDAALRRTSVAP
jgi:hypothetical protein